jgi:hypothetical protein
VTPAAFALAGPDRVETPHFSAASLTRPRSQSPGDEQLLDEIERLVKASKKLKGPALAELVKDVDGRVRAEVPEWAADSGWIASTRAIAARLATPVAGTPIEFGPIRTVSEKTGHPPVAGPSELFRPRTVSYRFGTRDYFRVDKAKGNGPTEPKDVAPENQLAWILAGHPPDVELAVAAIQSDLDVDRSRDKLSRFLEYWRNGRESFYEALDRTAGTKEAVFFYDSMLGEFTAKLAPDLLKARTLSEKHDRLHEAFLTLRQYRRFIEAVSLALVSTDPFPPRLKDFDYSVVAGSAQTRDALEIVLASHKGDVAKALEALKAVLAANPMPPELWGKYDPPSFFTKWFVENSATIRAAVYASDPGSAGMDESALAVRCRTKRRDIETKVRSTARACLQERGITSAR